VSANVVRQERNAPKLRGQEIAPRPEKNASGLTAGRSCKKQTL